MKRLRIAWIYHTASTYGGSFASLLDILDRRDADRFEIVGVLPAEGSCAADFARRGVRSVYLAERPASRSWQYAASVAAFAGLFRRERIDLVYVTDYVTWRSSALTAAALTRTPYVVHLRAPLDGSGPVDPSLLRAAAVVGNSRATLGHLAAVLDPARVHVVYNFIDFERFAHARDIRDSFFPGGPPVVGFVGFFRPEKAVEYFLEMAGIVRRSRPDVRFLAVGGESTVRHDGWFDRMVRYAHDLGVGDVVHFTGPRTDIPDIMASLDVLAVPSLNEGFGRVIVEANAAGKPVVGANAAGIPEVIEEGITGVLVPPRDSRALAAAVLEILDRSAWRAQVAATAPGRVRERFSPERQVRALEAVWVRAALDG